MEKQWTELSVKMNLGEYQAWTLFCFWFCCSLAVWSWTGHFPSVDFISLTRKMNSTVSLYCLLRWLGISPGCFPWIIAYWESSLISFFPVRKPAALQRPQRGVCLSVCVCHGDHPAMLPDQHALLQSQPGGCLWGHHLLHAIPALRPVRGVARLRGLYPQDLHGELLWPFGSTCSHSHPWCFTSAL